MNYKKPVMVGVGLLYVLAAVFSAVSPFLGKASALVLPKPTSLTWADARNISVQEAGGNVVGYSFAKDVTVNPTQFSGIGSNPAPASPIHVAVFISQSNPNPCALPSSGKVLVEDDQPIAQYFLKYSDMNTQGANVLLLVVANHQAYKTDGTSQIKQSVWVGMEPPANPNGTDTNCQVSDPQGVNISNAGGGATTNFNWVDGGTIVQVDNNWVYRNSDPSQPLRFIVTSASSGKTGCFSWMDVDPNNPAHGTYYASVSDPSQEGKDHKYVPSGGCYVWATGDSKVIGGLTNRSLTPGSGTLPDNACTTTDANGTCTGKNDTLSVECGGGALNWIICPVMSLAIGAAEKIDNIITGTLDVDAEPIFDTGTASGKGYYTAWNSFRILAVGLIIIAGLVMVASQALGFEFLDAYTIRKTMPRLVVAVIGISLSWPIMNFVVVFFDTLGIDARNIVTAPFASFHAGVGFTASFLLANGAVLALFSAYGLAALSFLLTIVLSVLVGFVVLVIRQVAIIMLIISAPLAIACYVLPGTQKIWKLWYENFLGLMLMFPIISLLIAAGHVFAAIALSAAQ